MRHRSVAFAVAGWLVLLTGNPAAGAATPRDIQTFSGRTPVAPISCDGATPIRTAAFTKDAAESRLRITYKDTASSAGTVGFTLLVVGSIDGVAVTTPSGLRMAFGNVPFGPDFYSFYGSFTLVGYADAIAAGGHTMEFVYNRASVLTDGFTCFRTDEPFLIEIEELP